MNPYSKPAGGSYKPLIIEGLRKIGRVKDAEQVMEGSLQFGLVSSFTGAVRKFPEMVEPCIKALEVLTQTDVTKYYIYALKNGDVMPVSPDGAFVYREDDAVAVAYVKEQLAKDNAKVYKAGELYFKS